MSGLDLGPIALKSNLLRAILRAPRLHYLEVQVEEGEIKCWLNCGNI